MTDEGAPRLRARLTACFAAVLLACAAVAVSGKPGAAFAAGPAPTMQGLVPAPAKARPAPGDSYKITAATQIYTEPGSAAATRAGTFLAGLLRPSTGYPLPVGEATGSGVPKGIFLLLSGAPAEVGGQGYRLTARDNAVVIRANKPAGLYAAVQTLRQLLPASVESDTEQAGPWIVPGGVILDHPRFRYRSAMLDVARHFFSVEEVKRYIDLISLYKVNYLHLHLTDDQGWRIMIDSWPRLAKHGGNTEVGGGPGGYYTKADYKRIVRYAQRRSITIVPEIDMPGHTTAALASYGKLNCDGTPPDLYTGTEVGFSSLCVDKGVTYEFVDDVIREVAAMTPGPYIHIGGDEAHETSPADYDRFMDRVVPMVRKYGKTPIGWHQITGADPPTRTTVQYWGTDSEDRAVPAAAREGHQIVLSPASHAYLDMKYNESTELGLTWAGYTPVKDAYGWNPGSYLKGVSEQAVLGTESPLWSETVDTIDEVEFLAFPRLAAVAELGWSPASAHSWSRFRERLAEQGPRWNVMDVDFYRSPQVPWPGR